MEDRLAALNNERQRRARIDQLRHNTHRLAHQPPSSPHIGDVGGGGGGLRSWSDPSRTSCHVSRAGSSMSHLDHSHHNFTNYTPRYPPRPHHGGRTGSGRTPSMAAAPGAAASLSGGSPRHGSMSPLRQHRRKPASSSASSGYYSPGELSIVEQRPPSGRTSAPDRLTSHPLHSANNNSNNSNKSGRTEMMEKSGFTNTLDLIDGDCVREEAVDYFSSSGGGLTRPSQVARARFGYGPLHPVSGGHGRHKPPLSDTAFSHSQRGGRSKFFENEDDSPLLVSSIDGVSTQVTSRVSGSYGDGSGPSSLGEEEDEGDEGGGYLLLRSGSQFSLLTPAASPFTLMKMRGEPRGGSGGDVGAGGSGAASRLGSVNNLAMGVTPYSSIRKRLKSVSMKYLKIMPKLSSSGSTSSSCSPGGRGPAASCHGGSTAGSTLSSLGRPHKKSVQIQVAEFERL
jgi:hypothetical protein